MMNPRTAILAAAMVALAALAAMTQPPPAEAHDHRPPKAVLMKGAKELQAGYLRAYCWWYPPDPAGEFQQVCLDKVPNWPEADRVAAGSKLRARVFKTQKPDAGSFEVVAFSRVDRSGLEAGRAQRLAVSLKPVVRDGRRVAWDAVFYVNRPDRHYYLFAGGQWQDAVGGSSLPPQDATWNFHVKTPA